MTTRAKLLALRVRLVEAQRDLLNQAAEADVGPAGGALARIADLERAIVAVETMIEEESPSR